MNESDEESENEDKEKGEEDKSEEDADEEMEGKVEEEEGSEVEMLNAEKQKQQERLKKVGYHRKRVRILLAHLHVPSLQKKKMKVKTGEVAKEDPFEKKRQEKQEYRLRERMIKKKHKNLYRSMMKGRQERSKEIWLLRKKRRLHETSEKQKRKEERKQKKVKPVK